MNQTKSVRRLIMFSVVIGLSLGLFQFWPFTLVFFLLGGIATVIVSATTGYMVDFFLVLIVEYLLMVSILSFALYVQGRRFEKK